MTTKCLSGKVWKYFFSFFLYNFTFSVPTVWPKAFRFDVREKEMYL